jgi:hypothetical protein
MISFFHAHEAAFDHLASMAQADMELYGLTREAVFVRRGENNWADATPQSISDSRWSSYQALFRELELPNGFAKDGPRISFLVDQVSIWNGDSSKGYVYSAEPLPTCALDLRVCAQKAPIVYGGATVYKFIKPRWYLWLFYN